MKKNPTFHIRDKMKSLRPRMELFTVFIWWYLITKVLGFNDTFNWIFKNGVRYTALAESLKQVDENVKKKGFWKETDGTVSNTIETQI